MLLSQIVIDADRGGGRLPPLPLPGRQSTHLFYNFCNLVEAVERLPAIQMLELC